MAKRTSNREKRIAEIRAKRESNPNHPVNVLRRVVSGSGKTPIVEQVAVTKSKTTGRKLYDPDRQNDDRAEWARESVALFQEITGSDDCDAVSDLLSDLMHLCDRSEDYGSFAAALDRATMHYEAETSKNG